MPQSPNKILAALPARDYQRFRPLLRTVHLSAEAVLPHCGHTRVYFPGMGLCSVITRMADDSMIEIASVGNEGVVGLPAISGRFGQNTYVQVGNGSAQYLPTAVFDQELARTPALRELLDTHCHALLETSIQAVACNQLHSIEERCCRWLLSVHDRIGRVRFELEVRFLARAMGVRNSDIAVLLKALEDNHVIRHDGGSVTILDAVGLQALACRCYEAMKRAYTRSVPVIQAATSSALPEKSSGARILPMWPAGACTLCGSSLRLPHRSGHECIVALDEEIKSLARRTHTLRKCRAELVSQRTQLFRDVLTRTRDALAKRTLQ